MKVDDSYHCTCVRCDQFVLHLWLDIAFFETQFWLVSFDIQLSSFWETVVLVSEF
jgi:hypothetical protein